MLAAIRLKSIVQRYSTNPSAKYSREYIALVVNCWVIFKSSHITMSYTAMRQC